ncbi:MAG: hypothetical protein ACLFSQ_09130 [Candidatus Zixiibacteriota bacterium]
MNIQKTQFSWGLIFLLLLFSSIGLGYRCYWYVISPGGDIGLENTGTTAGQAAIGNVSGSASYGEGTYGFWYKDFDPVICFEIDHTIWDLDTADVSATRAMIEGDQFELSNCGNCHLTFSLEWVETSPAPWVYGYGNGIDKFVTRARFTEDLAVPAVYDPARDYITDTPSWSSEDKFGPAGYDLTIDDIEYLWLEFLAPQGSSEESYYDIVNEITYRLEARANLP